MVFEGHPLDKAARVGRVPTRSGRLGAPLLGRMVLCLHQLDACQTGAALIWCDTSAEDRPSSEQSRGFGLAHILQSMRRARRYRRLSALHGLR